MLRYLVVYEYSSTLYAPKGQSGYGPNMQQFQLSTFPIKFGEASNLVKIWLLAKFIERRPNRTETYYAILWCMNILLHYMRLKATQVTVQICNNFSWIHCQLNFVRRQTWSKFDFLLHSLNEYLTERRHITLSCAVWIFFYIICT